MPRSFAYEVPVDTGLFTPRHLQPTAACRLAFNAAGRWLSLHAISHRHLVAEHQTGFDLQDANKAIDTIQARLEKQHPAKS